MNFDNHLKIPHKVKLNFPELIQAAKSLAAVGKIAVSTNNLIYLDIDDNYIHQLFPLLKNSAIQKPDYFGKKSGGAHITVIYPEEKRIIQPEDLNQQHRFTLQDFVMAEIGQKIYYILLIKSPTLLHLRRKYGLSDKLCFKGYEINFHITIGVNPLNNLSRFS